MKKIIKISLLTLISSTLLQSCSLLDMIELFNYAFDNENGDLGYEEKTDFTDESVSRDLINNAFNATKNSKNQDIRKTFKSRQEDQEIDGVSRLSFTKNCQDLEYNYYLTPTKGNVKGLVLPVYFKGESIPKE